jgi:tripartite ATP-independent transporter DctP family solute receptor
MTMTPVDSLSRRSLLAAGAALGLTGCGDSGRPLDRPLFSADAHPQGYPTVKAVEEMARLVKERTNGELSIRIYAGGQLGSESDTLEITMFGGIDLNRVNLAPLNPIAPPTLVLSLPFLFESIPHARRTFDGAPGERILASLEPRGLIGLCFYDSGARSFYNTRGAIRTPDDLAGLKVRVQASDLYVAMVAAAGGNPTPIPLGEVYQALVQGVVDAAENNWPSYETTRHYESARYYSLTRHVMAPEVLVMSRRRWEKLPQEHRDVIRQAAKDSVPYMRTLWDAREAGAQERLLKAGVQLNDDIDVKAFQARMLPVWERFMTTPELRGLVEEVRALGGGNA